MIRLEQITHSFGHIRVLDDISMSIDSACTVALIGPSGCGKSTLLRIIAGLVTPDHGTTTVGDKILTQYSIREIRDQLGYVIQDGGLFPHLTARENIIIRAQLARWSSDQIDARVAELLALTRFPADALGRYPAKLSGGQRQRVGIMRALMMDPKVLLLDEPLAALDPMIRRELQDDLRDIFQALQKTVLLVTHDLHEAAWFSERIVLMNAGRIAQIGSAQDFNRRPASDFVTTFARAQRTSDFGAPPC